jgi:hypothetical protein
MNIKRLEVEEEQKWREEIARIPHLKFPQHWAVKIIPPFGDAVVRFRVQVEGHEDEKSVYLDTRGSLGYWADDKPYWEVYPYQGDVGRCDISDTEELFRMIECNKKGE